jgi:predicted RNase H-related nuclease YkuK (DUF458 family)
MEFRKLSDNQAVDLVSYVKEYLTTHPNHEIYIGCDSQNAKRDTRYGVVVVLYAKGKGGHVLYAKDTKALVRDRFTRLWGEVELSIEIATFLRSSGIDRTLFIDLDLNPDPKYKSNQVLRSAMGYVEGMGFKVRIKPYAVMASYVADTLVK